MLYQDADDKVLEQDIYIDLNEVERVGPTDRVHMVAQIDRYRGGFTGDGNWTQTRRFVIEPDQDLSRVASNLIGEGELLDETMLGQEVKGSIDRAIANARIAPPHPLEDLARGQVVRRLLHRFEDHRALRGLSIFAFRGWFAIHRATLLTL